VLSVLVVIPARGGSKGIPRKNLRSLQGKPLLYYAIHTALQSRYSPDIYVSSDDDEILSLSRKIGAKTIQRSSQISKDATTLDPVIYDAFKKIEQLENKAYDLIVTLQPTSPLLKANSLDEAIGILQRHPEIETVISATDDTHLTWKKENDRYVPNYNKRVNRQYLTPVFKETGGFLITRSNIITESSRIGKEVELYLLESGESIDIDTYEDWNLCEYYLKRKKILFVVSGYREIGLGHVYNTLQIANNILDHQIAFLVDTKSQMAFDKIASRNYMVYMQENEDIGDDIKRISPDIVINDRLDTELAYVSALKSLGIKVINFEDLGAGARKADLVINAIYPEKEILPHHYFGHQYFILRDEFLFSEPRTVAKKVSRVLLTFGGVDPNNYTRKVLESIYDYCLQNSITLSVVAGFGYRDYHTLKKFTHITVHKNAVDIAEHMKQADIIFTSAGRTVYEIASLHIPAVVLAQNERELSHFFASEAYGFTNLGLGYNVDNEALLRVFQNLVESYESRKEVGLLMEKTDLRQGRKRVLKLIKNIVEST